MEKAQYHKGRVYPDRPWQMSMDIKSSCGHLSLWELPCLEWRKLLAKSSSPSGVEEGPLPGRPPLPLQVVGGALPPDGGAEEPGALVEGVVLVLSNSG